MFSEDCRQHGAKTKQCVSENFCFHKCLSFPITSENFGARCRKSAVVRVRFEKTDDFIVIPFSTEGGKSSQRSPPATHETPGWLGSVRR
jgi:hypothetical protein